MNKEILRPNRRLGQNFFVNPRLLRELVDRCALDENYLVFEVGAGTGELTALLVECAGAVISCEIDRRFAPLLKDRFAGVDNLQLLFTDVRKLNFAELAADRTQNRLAVLANLPYYITTVVLEQVMTQIPQTDRLGLMTQLEAAERLTAPPGTPGYGPTAIVLALWARVQSITKVAAGNFRPRPPVESCWLCLERRSDMGYAALLAEPGFVDGWLSFLKSVFTQQRKTLANALDSALRRAFDRETETAEIASILRSLNLDPQSRPGVAEPQQWLDLYCLLLQCE
ncbi:MAG: ribosomal RNA small subunit methyltransferase A [Clostridiaceae bacterium]|nr:ribosomal RNA small subunit methyltransferase A [Clostridiaceae bacterium]